MIVWLVGALALACAGAPPPPQPGLASVWGVVHLVPPDGASASVANSSYGDRRLAGVRRVDYSRPGFVIVHAGRADPTEGAAIRSVTETEPAATLTIREANVGPRLEPAYIAFLAGREIRVSNAAREAYIVSCPSAGAVLKLAAGESALLQISDPGAHEFFLLGVSGAYTQAFASPGPFTIVSDSGRFVLSDLPPGPRTIHAWHPRLPPIARGIALQAGQVLRLDLELGVGVAGGSDDSR